MHTSIWIAAAIASLCTLMAVLIAVNLLGGEKRIDKVIPRLYESDDSEFDRALSYLLGPQILEGNRITTLINGDQIFEAMLSEINNAKVSITFETFIYWDGKIGEKFILALSERARAGVEVRVLLDWVGSLKMRDELLETLSQSGARIVRFHRPTIRNLSRMNNRTHRKLLVVDGRVGFTGGVGIADQWQGNARSTDEWRDSHFRIEGPVVAQVQSVFVDNWMRATGKVLHGDKFFPALVPVGNTRAQMFASSPSGGSESMHLMYMLALTAAKARVLLTASYFVPDPITIQALVAAAKRGVKVRIIVPNHNIDSALVRFASHQLWLPLLSAGVELAEFQPTMLHVKSLVVDAQFTSVGSTNFDNRSFRLNDEANLNILDRDFANKMSDMFEADWANSKKVSFERWKNRPMLGKLAGSLALLFRKQL